MTSMIAPSLEKVRDRAMTGIRSHWKLFLLSGVLMLLLGMLSITLPRIATLEIDLLVGWLFTIGGVIRIVTVIGKQHVLGFWWSALSGMFAIVVGTLLITRPMQGVITLTLLLTVFFVIEGVAAIFFGIEFRRYVKWSGWTIFGGLANLIMAYLIWRGWPATADWVVGLFAGLNMIFLGMPLIALALTARRGTLAA